MKGLVLTIDRIAVDGDRHPNFVGCWKMEDPSVCDEIVRFFDTNEDLQTPGRTGDGKIREDYKASIDMTVTPNNLEDERFGVLLAYFDHLKVCYQDYLEQWDFLKTFLSRVHIGSFNIQKYNEGGHFAKLHSERTSLQYLHRTLVWMTYLNDVEDGGETAFPSFDLKIKPEKGKTIIWPADWTHAHFGSVVNKGSKYIITGWVHHPDDA